MWLPVITLLLSTSGACATEASSPITVKDLVRFANIGDPLALDWRGGPGEREDEGKPALFSPDGAHVAVLVGGGDPERQTNNATLYIYDTAKLLRGAQPLQVGDFASATPYQPIAYIRWLLDNETLVFAGTRGEEASQIYRVNIRTRALEALTHATGQFVWYDVAASGNHLITLRESTPLKHADNPDCKRHGCRVTEKNMYAAERGAVSRIVTGTLHDASGGKSMTLVNPESIDARLDFCDAQFSGGISPDGRYAIRLCRFHAEQLPAHWGEYTMNSWYREAMDNGNTRAWRFGFVVDLGTGRPASWTDAPVPHASLMGPPIWIDGGRGIILPAVFESLIGVDAKERARRAESYAVQLLDPATRKIIRIGRLDSKVARIAAATWDEKSQTLTVRGQDEKKKALPPAYFRRAGGRWTALKDAPQAGRTNTATVRLAVEQSLNERPVLYAMDNTTGEKRQLLDPNPWLAQRQLGRVEAISWTVKGGRTWKGGLYYPPGYQSGKRYPVMLQTHGFVPKRFSLHGIAKNFPGHALAAHDIMVLQIDEDDRDAYHSKEYWAVNRAGYEGAIDHLDKVGLIDRNRVGTVGWSATGPTTASMFTHSEYSIAAAAFTDTGVYGWWYDTLQSDIGNHSARFGGSAIGTELAGWLELSPTFNFARMRTPLLMWGGGGVGGVWDWYAGLRSLGKPVELWNLPTGTHDIYQASQRIRTNQLLVDWFRFWLKDEQRTEAGAFRGESESMLAEQYTRWREMRKRQDEILKQPRPPLLRWTPTPVESADDLVRGTGTALRPRH